MRLLIGTNEDHDTPECLIKEILCRIMSRKERQHPLGPIYGIEIGHKSAKINLIEMMSVLLEMRTDIAGLEAQLLQYIKYNINVEIIE